MQFIMMKKVVHVLDECDIGIEGNPLKENTLYTYQDSFDYKGDKQSLSEYQYPNKDLKALEYEVFQIIFY